MIQGLPADTKLAGQLRFLFAGGGPLPQIGYLFGGIIGVEKVFNYFGLGSTMLRAVGAKDIPVLQGAVLLVGIVYMLSTLLADLLIAVLNPRVRLETKR